MRWVLVGLVCVGLTGCGLTPEGRARRAAQLTAQDEGRCAEYGATRGSPGYTNCMLTLQRMRQDADIAQQQNGIALMGIGAGMMRQPVQPVRPVQTNCNRIGNQVNCLSY